MSGKHPNPRFPYGVRRHADPVVVTEAVAVQGLTVSYSGEDRPAVCDATFRVSKGTVIAVHGANGAGKSSLLKAIAGVIPIAAGTVTVFGLPRGACHHRTAYLPQRGEIDWRFPVTVERLVMAGRFVHLGWFRGPGPADREAVRRALDRLNILNLCDRQISALSGGQQQRVLMARAMAQGADLLLLDEPFNNLDATTRAELRDVFAELKAGGKTLVVSTHETDRPADEYDAVLRVTGGRVEGTAA